MNKTLQILIVLGIVLVVAAGSFYAGTVYGQQQVTADGATQFAGRQGQFSGAGGNLDPENMPQFPPDNRTGNAGGNRFPGLGDQGRGRAMGQIAEIDGDTLHITTRDGAEVTVLVTTTTLIEKYASVSTTDLETGETVIISGSENEDGSITARSLQVAPLGRMGNLGQGTEGNAQ